jgi:CHAT domain-containing protein
LPETQPGRSKLADQVRQLREELNWYYRQIDLQDMRTEDRSPKDVEALRRYSRQQETRLIRTLNLLEQTDQEFSSVQEAYSVELLATRSTLPANTTLVEYYIANGTVMAVVLDAHAVNILPTTLLSTVDELRLSLGASLSRKASSRSHDRGRSGANATLSHLGSMYTELVEPIAHLLSGERLLIVPHGQLFYLPFHAFRVGDSFFSERYSITYTPSSTAFHLARLKPRSATTRHATLIVSPGDTDSSESELNQRLLRAIPNSALLGGPAVTEEELATRSAQVKLIHLQTRAQLRQDNPMFSTIMLGTERVHLFDLFQLKLDVDLVTVAGCAPGVEAKAKGNEIVGLVRGLLYAGARSVLTTLWDVDDDTWVEFSELFYGALESGRSRYDSLQLTTSALRIRSEDPLRWAPFVLFGDVQ